GELARLTEDTPRIEAEITHRGYRDLPREPGHVAELWGLRLRNIGATAEFHVFVKIKTPGTNASDGERRRVSFVGETREARIITGAETTAYFAMTDRIPLYKDAVVNKALVYFDERTREDTDIWLVPTVEAPVSFGPRHLVMDFEITVVSEPRMTTEWKRT